MDRDIIGPVKTQAISLGLMVSISETLASLVRDMLGPGGQQTLLSTPTGKALVTRDGLTIVSSLHLGHPVAQFITQSLQSHCSLHHDGSKTFILYLCQILKDIKDHLGEKTGENAMSRMKLSLELTKFLCNDLRHIVKLAAEKVRACTVRNHEEDFCFFVKDVLKSSLQTCLQKQMVPFFTDILVAFLSLQNAEKADAESQLSHILQHFDMYHTKVCTQPQQKSRVCKGILLETNLQTNCQDHVGSGAIILKRFALMDANFGETENVRGENTVSIHLSSDKVGNLLSQKRASLEQVLKTLKSAGVHVLLCSEPVPQFMHGLCRENGITVECLPTEKLMFLRDLTGVSVLTDLAESVPSRCFFRGRISSFVQIGRKIYTMIELAENSCPSLQLNHLVVCAPTEGMCDQLCQSLYKALKAVSVCWKPPVWGSSYDDNIVETNMSPASEAKFRYSYQMDRIFEHANDSSAQSFANTLRTVNCGGTLEAVLHIAVSDYYTTQNYHPSEHVDSLIQKMLLSVPRALHANLCSGKHGEQHQFTEKWTSLLSSVHKGHLMALGIHGAVAHTDYIEPFETKLSIVANVLQLVIQLLRVEAVVPVKKLLSSVSAKELTDEEKEHEV